MAGTVGDHELQLHAMMVLVCGSRNWQNEAAIRRELVKLPQDTVIIHGTARGADRIAGRIARELGFEVVEFPAQWDRYGKAAGFVRNQEMLDQHPDLVLAFAVDLSKAKGTSDMISRASAAGVEVKLWQE